MTDKDLTDVIADGLREEGHTVNRYSSASFDIMYPLNTELLHYWNHNKHPHLRIAKLVGVTVCVDGDHIECRDPHCGTYSVECSDPKMLDKLMVFVAKIGAFHDRRLYDLITSRGLA